MIELVEIKSADVSSDAALSFYFIRFRALLVYIAPALPRGAFAARDIFPLPPNLDVTGFAGSYGARDTLARFTLPLSRKSLSSLSRFSMFYRSDPFILFLTERVS
jgi:hypothetical protein